jgi:hypothetical protein
VLGILALLAVAQTSTTSADVRQLRVVLLPTYGKPIERGPSVLDQRLLAAFTRDLHREAASVFKWRRWSVPSQRFIDKALDEWGGTAKCLDARCYDAIARNLRATHWLAARVVEAPKGRCFATVVLEDLLEGERDFRAQKRIDPCTVDNALAAARDLAREAAKGPRAPILVTQSYTALSVPSIGVPSPPDLEGLHTTTVARERKELGLDRALALYKQRHLIAFSQELYDDEWGTFVARNGRLVDECTVRKAAGLEIDDDLETFCEGNNWEWAWLGVPVGAVVSIGSVQGLRQGTAPGVLGFVFGVIASTVSAALALALNVDAAEPEDGEYWSHWTELERMVAIGNRALREKLDLTAAEVEAAGMRR